ncbi:MAG TPA: cytochrome c-type biogenesis protein CcmH [Ilumatobacter sp.]|nr:cytochrome c-type biogenesis protein CcmH [Ilumatobacter sp.]
MSLARTVKRWPAWALLVLVVVGFMAVGTTRDSGPRTEEQRIESISKRLACPTCVGESVFESRNPASQSIVEVIGVEVRRGELSDDEIIQRITAASEGKERLVPSASGIEALAWALPAAAFVIGVTGLAIAFRRWRDASQQLGAATDDDYALVAAAMAVHDAEAHDADDRDVAAETETHGGPQQS